MEEDYRVPVQPADRIRASLASFMVALTFGPGPEDGSSEGRRAVVAACRARRLSMYLAHVGFGWPLERVAHAFGVNRATAGVGCRWAEDARDDPAVDRILNCLERVIRDLCEVPKTELAA